MTQLPSRRPTRFATGDGKPVVAIDIDGTLGDYHSHFLWFAEHWLGITMPSASDVNPGMRLSEFMGVPHHVYRECKLAYRQGGLKRFMPVYPEAPGLMRSIRAAGAEAWICTSRPYLRLDNIDPDTREWLSRNNIEYDAVIFEGINEGDKYRELTRQVDPSRIVAAADDLPEQLDLAYAVGIERVYVHDQPYNKGYGRGIRIGTGNLETLAMLISGDIRKWYHAQK